MANDNDATVSEMVLIARRTGDDDSSWEQIIRAELRRCSFLVAYRLAMTTARSMKDQAEGAGEITSSDLAEQKRLAGELVGKYLIWVADELAAAGIGGELQEAR